MPLHVYYDTRLAPVTFDFATFLVNAEAHSQLVGTTSIYLYIIAPKFRMMSTRDVEYDDAEKTWRVHHILGQLPRVLPSVKRTILQRDSFNQISYPNYPVDYPPLQGSKNKFPYFASQVIKNYRSGLNVQPFRASEHAKFLARSVTRGHSYTTISLRTSKFQTTRNSNLDAWYQVYSRLTQAGKTVWVIPDFEDMLNDRKALQYDWKLAEFSAYDLDLRLALYEDAEDNLAVNNGVCSLLNFSLAPHKVFKIETQGIQATEAASILQLWGAEPGQTPEIFQDNQRWIWQEDTFDNIMSQIEL